MISEIWCGAFLLLTAAAVSAQAPVLGTVEGSVADAASGKPLAGARIKLSTFRDGDQHFTVADKHGRFQFAGIDLQSHQLFAEYPGYMNPGSRPAQEFLSAEAPLSAGNTHVEVEVRLQAYAVLSGRVTDAAGAPADNIRIDLLLRKPMGPARVLPGLSKGTIGGDELRFETGVVTDDRGGYRLPRLLPGRYYLMAESARFGGDKAYRDTYYPGESYAGKALEIAIGRAGEIPNVDIQLARRVGVRVSGRLSIASTGQPVSTGAGVVLWSEAAPRVSLGSVAKPDYAIEDVLPGTYVLEAAVRDLSMSLSNPIIPFAARRKVEVGDRDIDGLDIALQPTPEIPGTLRFAAGCPETSVALYDQVESRLTVTNDNYITLNGSSNFVLRSLIPGMHKLGVTGLMIGPLYRIGSARMAGVELGDRFEIPGAAGPLDIVMTCSPVGGRQ